MQVIAANVSTNAHKAPAAATTEACPTARQEAEKAQHVVPQQAVQAGQQAQQAKRGGQQAQQGGTAASSTPNAAPPAGSLHTKTAASTEVAALPPDELPAIVGVTSDTTSLLLLQLGYSFVC